VGFRTAKAYEFPRIVAAEGPNSYSGACRPGSLRTAAAELPTLSTAFCSASFDTPRAWFQYLTS
jgi:hypothetical protein